MSTHLSKIICLLVLGGAATLRAETLDQLSAEALRRHPQLRALRASVDAARGGAITAKTWQNPELTVAPGFRQTKEAGRTGTEFHGEFALSQVLLFPGKRQLLVALAEGHVALNKIALEAFAFQLTNSVRRAFSAQLAAEKIWELRREQIRSAQTFLEAAQKRVAGGYASDFEAVKGEADLIEAQKLAHAAEAESLAARVELNTLLQRDPVTPLHLQGSLTNNVPRAQTSAYLALARARNPSLRAQEKTSEIARLQVRKTRSDRRADIAIGPSVEYTGREQTYGIGATIALPLWNQARGEIATAQAEQEMEAANTEKLRAEISGAVVKAAAQLDLARAQLALYTPAFRAKLRDVVAQAERSYAQSATSVLIYLAARRTLFDAEAGYAEALAQLATRRADLAAAVGVPLELQPLPNESK